jgi:hypothetical protein
MIGNLGSWVVHLPASRAVAEGAAEIKIAAIQGERPTQASLGHFCVNGRDFDLGRALGDCPRGGQGGVDVGDQAGDRARPTSVWAPEPELAEVAADY